MEAIMCLPQNRHFAVTKDEWDTKEGIAFWVDLKACLGLVLPKKYCPTAI